MDRIIDEITKLKYDIIEHKQTTTDHYLNKFFIEKGNFSLQRVSTISDDVNKISQDGKLNIWMKCFLKNNRLYFEIAAESYISNGIAHSMEQIFSNSTPNQILEFNIDNFYNIFDDKNFLCGQKMTIDIIMNKIVDYATLYGRNVA